MKRTIRLANDYGISFPLWHEAGPAEREQFPISSALRDRLLDWAAEFNQHFDWETGWDDEAVRGRHASTVEELRRELVRELGDQYAIETDYWEI